MLRTPLSLRVVLSSLALVVGLSGLSAASAGQEQEISGEIAVEIDRRLAAPGAVTDLGRLSCPAETAEIWWWQYWSADDNSFWRLGPDEWPGAFTAFAKGESTRITLRLPASAALGSFALSIMCVDRDDNVLGRADTAITAVGQFDDIDDGVFYETPVLFARANGITQGTSSTTFSPDDPVLRWQMALFLRRLADLTEFEEATWPGHDEFADTAGLPEDRRSAIGWLARSGITRGTSDTEYDPTAPVTRWQMALFLRRFATYFGLDTTARTDTFADTAGLADYQREAIGWLAESGLTTGVGDNNFDPGGVVSRGQMVTFLMRMVEHLAAHR